MATSRSTNRGQDVLGALTGWFQRNALALALLVALLVLWQVVAITDARGNIYMPTLQYIIGETLANSGEVLSAVQTTLLEVVTGFVFSIIFGVLVGVLLAETYTARHMSMPVLLYFRSIPVVILAPLLLTVVGTDPIGIGIFTSWAGFFPVFISTITGLSQVPPEYTHLGDITGATAWQRLRYLKIWAAIPNIASGIKICANMVVIAAIVAEFIATASGLGHLLILAQMEAKVGLMFGILAITLVFGIVWFSVVSVVVDYLNPIPSE